MTGAEAVEELDPTKVYTLTPGEDVVFRLSALTSPKVVVALRTDSGKAIAGERIQLMIFGSGSERTRTAETDAKGVATFTELRCLAGTRTFVVLPDVLEAWGDEAAARIFVPDTQGGFSAITGAQAKTKHENGELDSRWNWSKDHVDMDRKQSYRGKDRTKYVVQSVASDLDPRLCTATITVGALTEAEKFAHFRDAVAGAKASYQTGKPDSYDAKARRWSFGRGAVCNQFANMFLAYWANHNAAYTSGAAGTSFLHQMENDSDKKKKDKVYKYRGFSGLTQDAVTSFEGGTSITGKFKKTRDGKRHPYEYLKIDGVTWDETNQCFVDGLMTKLGTYAIYSVTDGPKPTYDHHGGLFIIGDKSLDKLSADGSRWFYVTHDGKKYRYPPNSKEDDQKKFRDHYTALTGKAFPKLKKSYSQKKIEYKATKDLHKKSEKTYHLRMWPLKPLRAGGYHPADDTSAGDYVIESKLAKQESIADGLPHALSRFVYWKKKAGNSVKNSSVKKAKEFLDLELPKKDKDKKDEEAPPSTP